MCPHTTIYVSSYYYICVHILLYMCPHTTIYVSSYCYICVPIYMCPDTTVVAAYKRPRILVYRRPLLYMCPTIYVSSYHYICVLILHVS